MSDNQRQFTGRDTKGRFSYGNAGRPLGVKNKTSRAVLERVRAMEDGAIEKLWASVGLGEQWAITFVLSKLLPATRVVEFEGFTWNDLRDALTHGDISPEEGRTLTTVLKNICEIESFEDVKERLEELESMVKSRG